MMLWEFGFRNYYGFKEGLTLSFELDKNCPDTVSNGKPLSTIMCVKGANAAGKTTVLRALYFIGAFAARSFNATPGRALPLVSHFGSQEPVDFYIEFDVNGVRYTYELSVSSRAVLREEIFRKVKKKTSILRREEDTLVSTITDLSPLRVMKLRSNVSVISTAKQYGLSQLDELYDFFANIAGNVSFTGLMYEQGSLSDVSEELYRDVEKKDFVAGFLKEIDAGISNFHVHEFDDPDPADPTKMKKTYVPFFEHGAPDKLLTWHTESSGTRALVNKLPRIKEALRTGGVLLADEIDLHLHPMIVPKLLALFTCPVTNVSGAQLVFTTHQSDVLNIAGKYRTFIVNKRDNESFGFRLDEVAGDLVRNDRPVAPVYESGKVGGVPRL